MKKDINAAIAELVCLAQIASDEGKGIRSLLIRSGEYAKAIRKGYAAKDEFVERAITLIQKNISDWRYYCEKKKDQNGHSSKVITFTMNACGGRFFQISFHSFSGGMIKELALKKSGSILFWDRKNSRLSAFKAAKELGLRVTLR